ncbi:MAG: hypothetical protein DRP29_07300 [Thermodesulfobacteriota bacterium]|nr:MAG: hypothetical protein DRP29_07300 [Thermodesulfobacteriota bacterium]
MFQDNYFKISESAFKKIKCLILETDQNWKNLLKEFLGNLKISFLFAENQKELLEILKSTSDKIQIIVLDLKNSSREGIRFLRKLKENFPEIKILVVLEYFRNQELAEYFNAGADDIIFHPYTFGEFRARLSRLIKEHYLIQKLKQYIKEDPLTGVFNRRYFEKIIGEEGYRALRQKYPLTLFMIDLDNFKFYNDNFGHQAGDELLKSLAYVLTTSTRKRIDRVCRYGGDEFTIILPHINWEGSLLIVDRIFKKWERLNFESVTLSIGVAQLLPQNTLENTISSLIKRADEAMYKAKKITGNTYEVDPESIKLTLSVKSQETD